MSYQNRRRAIQFLFIGMTLLAVALWAAPSMVAQSLISGDIAGTVCAVILLYADAGLAL